MQQGIASAYTLDRGRQYESSASAAEVRRHTGRWAEVTELDDGGCLMEMKVDTFNWPAMLLGAIDADFEVVQPPELADQLRAIGERFVAATS